MAPQLITLDAGALDALIKKVEQLETIITEGSFQPRPERLTIQEAARHLKCDPSTIRRKIQSDELEADGCGKSRRVKVD